MRYGGGEAASFKTRGQELGPWLKAAVFCSKERRGETNGDVRRQEVRHRSTDLVCGPVRQVAADGGDSRWGKGGRHSILYYRVHVRSEHATRV